MTARDRLAALLSPELLDALEELIAERVAEALADAAAATGTGREWLTLTEAAELLGCTPDAVRMRARRGRLDTRHQGRTVYVSARSVATLTASSSSAVGERR